MDGVSLLAAFVAGLLSFVSPCVLPLIPGYVSFVSGVTLDEMRGTSAGAPSAPPPAVRIRILLSSVAFVAGFSIVFVSLGASASAVGQFLMEHLTILGRIAGAIIVLFGLHTMGVLQLAWLQKERRVRRVQEPAGLPGALLVGVAFAFGWTPCIGPVLAAILTVAAAQESVGQGVRLLAVYSLGLGIPFVVTSLAVDRFFAAFTRIRRHYRAIEMASGTLLVLIGVLIFTNRFTAIAQYLSPYLPAF